MGCSSLISQVTANVDAAFFFVPSHYYTIFANSANT